MRTDHDIAADEFLTENRMCIHAEISKGQPCPPWVMFTQEFYAPDEEKCCDVCGHLHGEHYSVSLMRLDSEEMLEFDFWFGAAMRGDRPSEYFLLASASMWTFYDKDRRSMLKRFPDILHEEADRLLNQSWEFYRFFTEEERLQLIGIN